MKGFGWFVLIIALILANVFLFLSQPYIKERLSQDDSGDNSQTALISGAYFWTLLGIILALILIGFSEILKTRTNHRS